MQCRGLRRGKELIDELVGFGSKRRCVRVFDLGGGKEAQPHRDISTGETSIVNNVYRKDRAHCNVVSLLTGEAMSVARDGDN